MGTYTQILYQVVFSTKDRTPTLNKEVRPKLYEYFSGVLSKKRCRNYRINGIEDHTHFLFSLHPSIALADLIKSLKHAGTYYLKEKIKYEPFLGWQHGYGAFTYSFEALPNLINYVIHQEEHHMETTYSDEYKTLLKEQGVEFDEKYLL